MRKKYIYFLIALLIPFAGCGDSSNPNNSNEISKRRDRIKDKREATVDFVWFTGRPGTESATGGASPMTLRIQPSGDRKASVGILEQFSGATGNQWKTSAWLAAFNATQRLGFSITDYEFIVKVGNHVDGPSAGMLMTATFMAMLQGDKILPNRTMTGTINPDGTAGPVGGIPQKIAGAKKKGYTHFGFPVGTRNSQDLRTGKMVDLGEVGRLKKVKVVEIHDIWEAYEFLTGKKLNRPKPVNESEMEVSSDVRTRLNAKVLNWKSITEKEFPALKERLSKRSNKTVAQFVLSALWPATEKALKKAKTFEDNGMFMAAYMSYVNTALLLRLSNRMMDFMKPLLRFDLASLQRQIDSGRSVATRVEGLEMELKVQGRKKTIGGRVNAVYGLTGYAYASSSVRNGDVSYQHAAKILDALTKKKLKKSKAVLAQLQQALIRPIVYYTMAEIYVDVSQELVTFGVEQGRDIKRKLSNTNRLAQAYGSAAGANLAYFEALVVEEIAKAKNVSKADVQNFIAGLEESYPLLLTSVTIAENAERIFEDDPEAAGLFQMAFGALAYVGAATLVNKYYGLRAEKQKDGTSIIKNRRALSHQLQAAKKSALEAASVAKNKVGFIPVSAQLSFQLGNAKREGDDAEKLEALESYWAATFWSNLASEFYDSSFDSSKTKKASTVNSFSPGAQ